ncbi:uncharacterized protein LOC143538447 [Bidens hawaiensis]|uniref:uncharacterized protein LOC143538447 n=1 Tax=Bidens hawaiensis TaxID=980011 RepID=UPI00404A9709
MVLLYAISDLLELNTDDGCGGRNGGGRIGHGAREVGRRSTESDDLLDSAIDGFCMGAILGGLQGGRASAVRYSIVIGVVGTGFDFAAIRLRPVVKSLYESVAGHEKKTGRFKWPEWLPFQVLDEEALAAKRAREEALCARVHDLTKEES